MHTKPGLRVFLKWMIARSGSVITAVIPLNREWMLQSPISTTSSIWRRCSLPPRFSFLMSTVIVHSAWNTHLKVLQTWIRFLVSHQDPVTKNLACMCSAPLAGLNQKLKAVLGCTVGPSSLLEDHRPIPNPLELTSTRRACLPVTWRTPVAGRLTVHIYSISAT